jgi:uncharacterized protein YuzE
MIAQDYEGDADALYLKLTDRKVARAVEVDYGTLADLDLAEAVVGIEVIQPDRPWPLEDVLSRFRVSKEQVRELRAQYHKLSGHDETTAADSDESGIGPDDIFPGSDLTWREILANSSLRAIWELPGFDAKERLGMIAFALNLRRAEEERARDERRRA